MGSPNHLNLYGSFTPDILQELLKSHMSHHGYRSSGVNYEVTWAVLQSPDKGRVTGFNSLTYISNVHAGDDKSLFIRPKQD